MPTSSSAPLQAVVFDYGVVLSGPPDPAAWDRMKVITALDEERFSAAYWAPRHDYDRGVHTGAQYWQTAGTHAGIMLSTKQIADLIDADNALWTQVNPPMIAWAKRLQGAGTPTGILSNLGDAMTEGVLARQDWLGGFSEMVWSYRLGMAKPEPDIYLHAAAGLGVPPEAILFIDDREANVAGAEQVGMQAIHYTTQPAFEHEMSVRGWSGLWLTGELPAR